MCHKKLGILFLINYNTEGETNFPLGYQLKLVVKGDTTAYFVILCVLLEYQLQAHPN